MHGIFCFYPFFLHLSECLTYLFGTLCRHLL
uniref:Uncharacterized protein n=1 Tax=Siphoviridae sp. ctoic9 TaxID=2825671 RepID=A0A8S5Q9K2_9CAUD|nr:MAG TPA: hypothetical protein [Siphoviridae sp. ctoic9]